MKKNEHKAATTQRRYLILRQKTTKQLQQLKFRCSYPVRLEKENTTKKNKRRVITLKLQPPVRRSYPASVQVWHHNHYHQLDYNQRSSSSGSISLPKCARCLRNADSLHATSPSATHAPHNHSPNSLVTCHNKLKSVN